MQNGQGQDKQSSNTPGQSDPRQPGQSGQPGQPGQRPANQVTPAMTNAIIMISAGVLVLGFGIIFMVGLTGIILILVGLAIAGVGVSQLLKAQKERSNL